MKHLIKKIKEEYQEDPTGLLITLSVIILLNLGSIYLLMLIFK